MFSATLAENSTGSWSTIANWSRRSRSRVVAQVDAVEQDPPGRGIVEARSSRLTSVVLPAPVWPDDADARAGATSNVTSLQHRAIASVAEATRPGTRPRRAPRDRCRAWGRSATSGTSSSSANARSAPARPTCSRHAAGADPFERRVELAEVGHDEKQVAERQRAGRRRTPTKGSPPSRAASTSRWRVRRVL